MRSISKGMAAMALAMALAMPLAACGGGQAQGGGAQNATAGQASQAATVDVSSWKTFGDALAAKTDEYNLASWDENYYVTVFNAGNSIVRVVVKMTPEVYEKISELDGSAEDYDAQFAKVTGGLELASAEDITSEKLSQSDLDACIGKKGQDLLDDGFVFESYYMYGGDETGATMAKGHLAYNVTFDTKVTEKQTEDEGKAIKNAKVTAVEYAGGSDAAVDVSKIK